MCQALDQAYNLYSLISILTPISEMVIVSPQFTDEDHEA